MKIVHVSTYLHGGAGKIISDLIVHQVDNGCSVVCIVESEEYEYYKNDPSYIEKIESKGVEVIKINSLFKRVINKNVEAARCISNILKRNDDVDIMHCHAAVPSFVCLLARGGLTKKIPIIQTMHGWGLNKTQEQEEFDIGIMSLIDKVAAVSSEDESFRLSAEVNGKAWLKR